MSTVGPKANFWRATVKRACNLKVALNGPLRVTMQFTFRPPANKPERIGQPHTQKPDSDNLAKLVLDVMQDNLIITDDSQVAGLNVSKVWGHNPGVAVTIAQIGTAQRAGVDLGRQQPPAWLTRS